MHTEHVARTIQKHRSHSVKCLPPCPSYINRFSIFAFERVHTKRASAGNGDRGGTEVKRDVDCEHVRFRMHNNNDMADWNRIYTYIKRAVYVCGPRQFIDERGATQPQHSARSRPDRMHLMVCPKAWPPSLSPHCQQ